MNAILEIPELVALDGAAGLIRIPQQIDVPVTQRVSRLIDTPEFQRLKQISQLGLVSFVYPAANHNRFEHSLGVYRMALLFLRHLSHQSRFTQQVSPRDATLLILAALFHDIGHWPFCHPMEDLDLPGVPTHETFCRHYLGSDKIAKCLREDWGVQAVEIIDLLNKRTTSTAHNILKSILSGPIDIDKMDYLYRDSLHAGVPYGQNFDSPRLLRSLCLSESGDRLAISQKGKTAAELMVFARYVMFSEVYWHHAVRSATAMFQRAFFLWHQARTLESNLEVSLIELLPMNETELIARLRMSDEAPEIDRLLTLLFGPQRQLYKRVANFSCLDGEEIYRQIAQRPYPWIVECSRQLANIISQKLARTVDASQILIDAPPVGLEVQFNLEVYYETEDRYRELGSVSPVVQTLAQRQFDDFVKQVRVFVDPELATIIKTLSIKKLLPAAIGAMPQSAG